MGDDGNWCLIESDPGVFTELMRGFGMLLIDDSILGVTGLECEELYDLNCCDSVTDALGFIFLFKWERDADNKPDTVSEIQHPDIFFAKQIINNACATQALINLLMNVKTTDVDIGPKLEEFRTFVDQFDSTMKGTALSNCEQIRTVHNCFAGYHGFELEEFKRKKAEELYHFVAYVPIKGTLYELDGLKDGPIDHGAVPDGTKWIDYAVPLLQKRMDKCANNNFNLMAVVPDRQHIYSEQLAKATESGASSEYSNELAAKVEYESKKKANYRQENIRRRHNYLPLIVELFKILGEQGSLVDLVKKAKDEAQVKSSEASTKV